MTIGTRLILKNRKPLETLLPLESPMVLFIDPCDCCCLRCKFCPSSDLTLMKEVGRPLQVMDFILYKKIIDDLQQFKTKIKVLRLYQHGESLLNPHFPEMVAYAKRSNKIETVDTTTNAICLNPELNLKIIESGIDRINISINGLSDEDYLNFTGVKINFKKLVGNIEHLYKNKSDNLYLFIKINGDTLQNGVEDEKKFLEIFEPIADAVAIEKAFACWEGFEPDGFVRPPNKNIGIYGQEVKKEVLVCPYSQYSISIQSNGEISQCFLDWNRKMIIGDANKESIYDIWYGKKFRAFQDMMLKGKRKSHFYCKNCNQLIGGQPSDIDEYAEEILIKRKELFDER